jgi:methyl-accepting chemotaxis protein
VLENAKISQKLSAAFAVLIAIFCLVNGLLWLELGTLRDATVTRDRAASVSREAETMMTSVVEQLSAVRAYTFLNKDEFLKTYAENAEALRAAGAAFKERTASAEQKILVDRFMTLAATWQHEKLDRIIALSRVPETRAQAQELAGVKQLGKMRDVMKEIRAYQEQRIDAASAALVAADRRARITLIASAVVGIGMAVMLGWMLTRLIARPATALTGVMTALARGDNRIEVPETERRDEMGEMARAVLVFRDAARSKAQGDAEQGAVVAQLAGGLGKLAQGDMRATLADFPASYVALQTDFNAAVAELAQALRAVTQTTDGIRVGAAEISQASDDLSRRTEQQAASLEETAAAMEQIMGTVRATASGASEASAAVQAIRVDANASETIVDDMVNAMHGIDRASEEIAEIISVIDGIAFQTNLLALNAGVEAARAGDAGKGFAVVASEVRALARRSADAATDVKARILASNGQVATGVRLVGETGVSLQRMARGVERISSLVASIARAAEDQASSLQQVNVAVGHMDEMTQQTAAMVEESTAASRSLADEAEALAQHVARFRLAEGGGTGAGNPVHRLQRRLAAV